MRLSGTGVTGFVAVLDEFSGLQSDGFMAGKEYIAICAATLPLFLSETTEAAPNDAPPNALLEWVQEADASYEWKRLSSEESSGFSITHLQFTSQTWRGRVWQHHLQIVRPAKVRSPEAAFLLISGDGDGKRDIDLLKTLADRAGALAVVLTQVPNQPLYDGRKEDALIAFTFDQYLRTGDKTWPLLFPMVKSAVRALDTVEEFARQEFEQDIRRFVVGGASKRGWTTWLTAAVDGRVKAIAPMVFDVLNMKRQTQWAEKAYGRQSEKIDDYTEFNLIERMDDPRMVELRSWVDPFSHRASYTMPKLILLGTNDPYWVVDALRHYWEELPEPKLLFQTPNAGHDLGGGEEAAQTLAAFFQMIADHQPLPEMSWELTARGSSELTVNVDRPAKSIRLWTADSADRDFRNDRWTSRELAIQKGGSRVSAVIDPPASGYRAYLIETLLTASTGHEYKLSTEARVVPDNLEAE